ncbi:MAG: FAD-binding protein [Hyphomicrobium sp.]|nr:FAD-binding protein [Hyphomicrobium sp.]
MSEILKPAADWELKSILAQLGEQNLPVEIVGAGTKRAIGHPVMAAAVITTASLRGISLYEPTELVMSARAGTPVSQVEAELASRGQMLPFEPLDYGPALASRPGLQTIGAVFATNNSGSRRITVGSARDHLIGVRGVNGRAEIFKSGGRVMKNVTGYDVARGLTGSWGTLAVLTEVTFKVAPLPDDVATIVYSGLPEDLAIELMSLAMGTPYEVSGTVHLTPAHAARIATPPLAGETTSLTALRVENFMKSVRYRKGRLIETLKAYGQPVELDLEASLGFWGEIRRMAFAPASDAILWRVSTSPRKAAELVATLRRHMPVEATYDWSGGLVWLEIPDCADAGAADIRRAVAIAGGHSTLIRAREAVRREVEVFQPQAPAIEKLSRGLKRAFDPRGLLNPGRMYQTM